VLKEKNLLLFISSLNIHKNDISDLMSIYDGIKKKGSPPTYFQFFGVFVDLCLGFIKFFIHPKKIKEKGDQYKIVWIPIVEQWTNNSRRKFEMLQSKMPWYIVQYFSAVAAIKFIEERYDNKPIVLLINPQGDVENENALDLIQEYGPFKKKEYGTSAFVQHSYCSRTPGPYEVKSFLQL